MAQFEFINQLSEKAIAWVRTLDPVVKDENLSEAILLKKIIRFLKENSVDADAKEHLLEISSLSFSIAQFILGALANIKMATEVTTFEDEAQFTNLLMDKFAANAKILEENRQQYQAAHDWLKTIKSTPISKFYGLWIKFLSFFSDEITTVQRIVNDKVSVLLDIDSLGYINNNKQGLVDHAKYHPNILEALISREDSRSFFSINDYDEKYLNAAQWFDLLLAHKDNPVYRAKICKILLAPRGFSFSEKSSLAYTVLPKHFGAIQNAGWGDLSLLNSVYVRKVSKRETNPQQQQQDPENIQQMQQQISDLQKQILELKGSKTTEKIPKKSLFTNVVLETPPGVVRQDELPRDNDNDVLLNPNKINQVINFVNDSSSIHSDEGYPIPTEQDTITLFGKDGEERVLPAKWNPNEAKREVTVKGQDKAFLTTLFTALAPKNDDSNSALAGKGNGIRDAWRLHVNNLNKPDVTSAGSDLHNDFAVKIAPKTEFALKV